MAVDAKAACRLVDMAWRGCRHRNCGHVLCMRRRGAADAQHVPTDISRRGK